MEKELFDTEPLGHYFMPTEVTWFMLDLAGPKADESVLSIGVDVNALTRYPNMHLRSQLTPISNQPNPEELNGIKEVYDVILCAPTFGVAINAETGESSEGFWLKWSVAHLSQRGRLAIIVPTGLLSNYSLRLYRQFILKESCLQAVFELPSGWAFKTAIQASVLLLGRRCAQENQRTNMFRVSSLAGLTWQVLAAEALKNKPQLPDDALGTVYTVATSQLDDLRLDAQYYDPKYTQVMNLDPAKFKAVPLAELVDIYSGERFPKEILGLTGVPLIQVGGIAHDGSLNIQDSARVPFDNVKGHRAHCMPGDILVTTAGTIGKVAYLGDQTPPDSVCIDTSLRRLIVRDMDQMLPEYLAIYLRSSRAQLQMERYSSGSVIRTLSSPNVSRIIVYLPSLDDQLNAVQAFQGVLRQQLEKLLAVFPDVEQMHSLSAPPSSPQVGVTAEAPAPAPGVEQSSLEEVVQYQFPFPIAQTFTALRDLACSYTERFRSLIDVSESIVYYLYGILAADQLRLVKFDDLELKQEISSSITNYSIDRRIDFIFHMIKAAKNNPAKRLFMPAIIDFSVGICREVHNNVRNRYAHAGSPPEPRCKQIVTEFEGKIDKLLRSLFPLTNYTLAQVKGVAFRNDRFQHTITPMIGNNPNFGSQIEDLDDPLRADTRHVVLIDQNYNVLDLHPFYMLHAWESTGMQNHLCFLKQVTGESPNWCLKVESTHGVGETSIEADLELSGLIFS